MTRREAGAALTAVMVWPFTFAAAVAPVGCDAVDLHAVTVVSGTTEQTDATEVDEADDISAAPAPVDVPADDTNSVGATSPADTQADNSTEGATHTSDDAGADTSALPSPGCLAAPLAAGDTPVSLQVGDTSRNYVLHVPEVYAGSEPVPLIVDFHGIGESGRSQRTLSTYPDVTDPEGVIIAFPDGMNGPLGRAWDFGPCCLSDVDDFAFARSLVNDVAAKACIDLDRVYAVGVLTGGGMVQHLACEAADVFAAVAPEAFDLLEETASGCSPSRPITVISRRSTSDARVPYAGGPSEVVPGMPITFLGAVGSLEQWSRINGCTGSRTAEDEHGCSFYTDCAEGVEVALCADYGDAETPAVANVAWPILKRHSR